MTSFLVIFFSLLVHILIVLLVAYVLPYIEVRKFKAVLPVALVVAILSCAFGAFVIGFLHLSYTGMVFLLSGARFIANTLVLKFTDVLLDGFKVHGFLTAAYAALIMTLLGMITDWLLGIGKVFKELW
jgi:uncharacterized membrane protein YvlD (DUF360 family)